MEVRTGTRMGTEMRQGGDGDEDEDGVEMRTG